MILYKLNVVKVNLSEKRGDMFKIILWLVFIISIMYFSFQLGQDRLSSYNKSSVFHRSGIRSEIMGNPVRSLFPSYCLGIIFDHNQLVQLKNHASLRA